MISSDGEMIVMFTIRSRTSMSSSMVTVFDAKISIRFAVDQHLAVLITSAIEIESPLTSRWLGSKSVQVIVRFNGGSARTLAKNTLNTIKMAVARDDDPWT